MEEPQFSPVMTASRISILMGAAENSALVGFISKFLKHRLVLDFDPFQKVLAKTFCGDV